MSILPSRVGLIISMWTDSDGKELLYEKSAVYNTTWNK